jgi:hypothetical protein
MLPKQAWIRPLRYQALRSAEVWLLSTCKGLAEHIALFWTSGQEIGLESLNEVETGYLGTLQTINALVDRARSCSVMNSLLFASGVDDYSLSASPRLSQVVRSVLCC